MLTSLALVLFPAMALAAPTFVTSPQHISPGKDSKLCLAVANQGAFKNGDAVVSVSCDTSYTDGRQLWRVYPGDSQIQLIGSNFCLDAGTDNSNNQPLKIWTCYPGLYQQQWYYTDDNRIAITGGNKCLDLGPNGPQTYQCTPNNDNQVWYTPGTVAPPVSSTTVPPITSTLVPSVTTSVAPPVSSSASPSPPLGGPSLVIHPNGRTDFCLEAVSANNVPVEGSLVQVKVCTGRSNQRFDIYRGDNLVRLSNSNLCLDAGSNIGNNVALKVWTCYPGLKQQQWYYTNDNRIAITGGNQCADNTNGILSSANTLQTYQCITGNNNQVFTVSN
ncbi:Ricin B lectin domain [Phaffia rhodozyma]|uniref:Ricin B lectin domain n=1 Tax=Phaffia rhodozyma TaxID=264483 RepID=A0A0F7SM39_PHARH|nr:Ricin B lectin domain [Phaffia rhodozyma]